MKVHLESAICEGTMAHLFVCLTSQNSFDMFCCLGYVRLLTFTTYAVVVYERLDLNIAIVN